MKKRVILSQFVRYAGLNVLGMIGISCYVLADTFFISKGMGTDGLAALNFALPAYSIMYGCGLMIGVGGSTLYNVYKERGDEKAGKRTFVNSLIAGVIFSVIFFVVGAFFPGQAVALLGAKEGAVAEMCETYFKVLWMFSPAFVLNSIVLSFLRNDGAPTVAMIGMVTGSLMNILLDWVFIFPLKMGIFGAILATGLSPIISLIVYIPYFLRKKNGFSIGKTPIEPKLCGKAMLIGFPSFLAEISTATVTFCFNKIMFGLKGNVGVAAYGVIANVVVVVLAMFNGIASGAQPLISKFYANENKPAVKKVLSLTAVSTAIVGIAVYVTAYFSADFIAGIFNSENNVEMQTLAVRGVKLYFIGSLFAGLNILTSTYFAAREKTVRAQAVSIARGFAVILPAAFIMAKTLGTDGLWLSFPTAEIIVLALSLTLIITEFVKERRTDKKSLNM